MLILTHDNRLTQSRSPKNKWKNYHVTLAPHRHISIMLQNVFQTEQI